MARFTHLPTPGELESMKDDLAFKEGEMEKARATGTGLAGGKKCLVYMTQHTSFTTSQGKFFDVQICDSLDVITTTVIWSYGCHIKGQN